MEDSRIEADKRKDKVVELVKVHLSPGSEYLDDAAIQWLLTSLNFQIRPELQWFMPYDPSGEIRIKSVLSWVDVGKQRFSFFVEHGELAAAVEESRKIRAKLALFEYLIETLKLET